MALTLPIFPVDVFLPLEREEMDPAIATGYESGMDQGRPRYSRPKMKWQLRLGALTTDERKTLNYFLRTVRKSPFLFFDRQDCIITGEAVGTGDGVEANFYLDHENIKDASWTVKVDGVAQVEGVDYTVNQDSGIITFLGGHIPGVGADITADYEWYYKAWNPGDSRKDVTLSEAAHEAELALVEFWP